MMSIRNLKVVEESLFFPDFIVEFDLGMETQRLDTKSPIHVHVAKNTPVHVHIKKKKKKLAPRGVPGIPTAVEVIFQLLCLNVSLFYPELFPHFQILALKSV